MTRPSPPPSRRARTAASLRYPLAIVLDHRVWRRWQQFKQQIGKKRDRDAFTVLLQWATEEGVFPKEGGQSDG